MLLGSIPGFWRCPGEGKGYHSSIVAWRIPWTLQFMESQSRTWRSDFHFTSQWIKICLPTEGTCVLSLVQEGSTYPRATKPTSHYYQGHALDPRGCNYWAHTLQLLSPSAATTEGYAHRTCAPQQEKAPNWEAHASQQRVAHAHHN